jgi:hypothetical protein
MAPESHSPTRGLLAVLIGASCLAVPASLLAQFQQGPEFRINTYTTGAQRRPAASSWANGFVVAWESTSQDGDLDGIFAQQYNSFGAPIGPEFRVNTYTTSSQYGVSVETDWTQAAPTVLFVWQSEGQDGDSGGVFAQRWSNGPMGGEFRVNTYTTSSQGAAAVSADGAGNFVVVWASLDQDGSGSGIFGQRYASSGAPLGGEFRVNTYTTGFQGHPSVGKDESGSFVVVWEGQGADDQPFGIYAQSYLADGTPNGGEFAVNSFTIGDQRYPRVNAGTGNFTVAWESDGQDGSGLGVFSYQDFRVNTFTTGAQNRPALWSRYYGNNVWVWQSDDNQDPQGGVFGQFAYGIIPILSEFRVNTYTAGTQDEPVVVRGNEVVVAWSSEQDPDGSRGIYAQRYNAPWIPVELQGFTVED